MMLSVSDFSNFTFVDVTLIIEQNAIIALIRNIDIKRFNISVFVNKCRDFCSYVHNLTTVIFKVVRFVIDIIERYSSAILNFGNFRKPGFFKPQFQVYFISVFYLFYGNLLNHFFRQQRVRRNIFRSVAVFIKSVREEIIVFISVLVSI